jgi:hypothetical protein
MRTANTNEDAAILETLAQMQEVPCCEKTESGCFRPQGDCCCSCDHCLCAYVAFQVGQGDALLSCYFPQLGYAVVVEILEASLDSLEGGEIVALIAPGKVWFPENLTGWIPISASKPGPQSTLLLA